MTEELRKALKGARNRMDPTSRRITDLSDRTSVVHSLTGADYISLAALFVAWASALLCLTGEPNWALLAMFGGFFLDKMDGWYARRTGTSSPFGRQVDSFIDIFVYLVSGALLYHVAISPTLITSLVVGFTIIAFGGLRLIRHNNEGFGSDGDCSYYHGTTVVHTNLVIVANYFLLTFLAPWNGWAAGATIIAVSPLMISNYKAYKSNIGHALAGVVGCAAIFLALALEFGYL